MLSVRAARLVSTALPYTLVACDRFGFLLLLLRLSCARMVMRLHHCYYYYSYDYQINRSFHSCRKAQKQVRLEGINLLLPESAYWEIVMILAFLMVRQSAKTSVENIPSCVCECI